MLAEGRPIFSVDEPGRVEFEVRSHAEYVDFLPTQRAHRDAFLRRAAAGGTGGYPDVEAFAAAIAGLATAGN